MECVLLAGPYLPSAARDGSKSGSGSLAGTCPADSSAGHDQVPGKREWIKERKME